MVTPDSGTSLLTVPSWAYAHINSILPFKYDCKAKTDFGNLTYVIDGIEYALPSHHFMEIYKNVFDDGIDICFNTIAELDILQDGQANLFIVGDAFMQIYYTIFDRDNDRVGLAKAKSINKETI
jgi:cathepsin D